MLMLWLSEHLVPEVKKSHGKLRYRPSHTCQHRFQICQRTCGWKRIRRDRSCIDNTLYRKHLLTHCRSIGQFANTRYASGFDPLTVSVVSPVRHKCTKFSRGTAPPIDTQNPNALWCHGHAARNLRNNWAFCSIERNERWKLFHSRVTIRHSPVYSHCGQWQLLG